MKIATERPTERKLLSFDEFADWYPDHATDRYELRRGVILEMPKPREEHSKIAGKLAGRLSTLIESIGAPYFIPRECLVKRSDDTGYEPDVIVLDEASIALERQWEASSII